MPTLSSYFDQFSWPGLSVTCPVCIDPLRLFAAPSAAIVFLAGLIERDLQAERRGARAAIAAAYGAPFDRHA